MFDQLFTLGPDRAVHIFGVRMVGFNAQTGRKVLLSIAFLAAIWILTAVIRAATRAIFRHREDVRARFWTRQAIQIVKTVLLVLSLVSIWFDDPSRFAGAFALISAGIAIAAQKLIASFAAYFVILRGRIFNIGDRITMGGVRGDVMELGFIRTTIMEMGQPPPVQSDEPAMWVEARQYTGRIVSVTNDRIFESPVYNYSRAIPFIWEEMRLPIRYTADFRRAEQILLEAAQRHTSNVQQLSQDALRELARRAFIREAEVKPAVYMRLTDNWLELTVRFVVHESGVRDVKNAMSRDILAGLQQAQIEVASATFEIVGLPEIEVQTNR